MLTSEWKASWELIEVIELIQGKMQKLVVEIIHIFREANQLADYIVNEVLHHEGKVQYHRILYSYQLCYEDT